MRKRRNVRHQAGDFFRLQLRILKRREARRIEKEETVPREKLRVAGGVLAARKLFADVTGGAALLAKQQVRKR